MQLSQMIEPYRQALMNKQITFQEYDEFVKACQELIRGWPDRTTWLETLTKEKGAQ